jgi:hypothetical protein
VKNEKRALECHPQEGNISFSIFNRQKSLDARSMDYSTDGLKFKATCALKPGTSIFIRIKPGQRGLLPDDLCKNLPSVFLAEVKCCRQLDGSDSSLYEVGVRYYPPVY